MLRGRLNSKGRCIDTWIMIPFLISIGIAPRRQELLYSIERYPRGEHEIYSRVSGGNSNCFRKCIL